MAPLEILLCLLLAAGSSFLSASEIALFSLSRFQIRNLKERFPAAHRRIKRLLADPGGLLVTILLINEVLNVSLATVIAKAAARSPYVAYFERFGMPQWIAATLLGTLVTAPVLLLGCEVTPKAIAARANQLVAPLASRPLSAVYEVLKPVRAVLQWLVSTVAQWAKRGPHEPRTPIDTENRPLLRTEEFLSLVEEGHKEGAIRENELELIRNVLELDGTAVEEVMTPIARTYSLVGTTSVQDALAALRGHRYSRVPVTGKTKRHITGILYSKDLLLSRLEAAPDLAAPVSTLGRKPLIVPPGTRLGALFRRLKQSRTHIAVVEIRPGEAIGVVTMSDVLDSLFEDLDESDLEETR